MRQIRPVSQDLSPAFLALSAQYLPGTAPETLRALLQRQPQLCLCLLLEGRLQGVCYGGPSPFGPGLLGLEGIAVAADFQNQGHGSALLAAFEAAGLASGFSGVSLGCDGGRAKAFYERNGYRAIEWKLLAREGLWRSSPAAGLVARLERQGPYDKLVFPLPLPQGLRPEDLRDALHGEHGFYVLEKSLSPRASQP